MASGGLQFQVVHQGEVASRVGQDSTRGQIGRCRDTGQILARAPRVHLAGWSKVCRDWHGSVETMSGKALVIVSADSCSLWSLKGSPRKRLM